ncbi:TraB/GumN family protein [Clostridium thermarum]|uniref:TraB/GumN family protein n=1 Tax=Clostridium thermarum TaxID=1716543 RepID=UPI00111CB4EC|nr:TraB/GumN family protein [Clostridium thermarum]
MRSFIRRANALILMLTLIMTLFVGAACNREEVALEKEDAKVTSSNVDVKKKEKRADVEEKEEASTEKKYGDVKGFLWELNKDNTKVYMYGSIHVGDKNLYPLHQVVEDAFESSDVVVGEIDMTNTAKLTDQAFQLVYTNGETVLDHLSEEGKKKIDEVCEELDFNYTLLKTQKIWSFGSFLSGYQMKKAGYDANYGIDMYFMNKAKGNKRIEELEGAEFQFDMLNNFTDEEQEKYFIMSLTNLEETKKDLDELFEIYKSGDESAMLKALGEEDRSTNYYKKMILDRNINMTSKIEGYLNTGDTYFVVAGLAHLIGEDGIVKMLQDKGYTVIRK